MYGLRPSAMIEKLASVPPEKTFRNPRNWLFAKMFLNATTSTPATGTCARNRNTRKMKSIKRIFLRNSGDLKLFTSV